MSFYEKFVKVMSPLVERYHRLEVYGLENIPPEGEGFILAPNHSGWFGWDAVVISSVLKDRIVHWLALVTKRSSRYGKNVNEPRLSV